MRPQALFALQLFLTALCFPAFAAELKAPSESLPALRSGLPDAALLRELGHDEEKLNLYCLRSAYTGLKAIETRPDGNKWLVAGDGRAILYSRAGSAKDGGYDSDAATVAESMALPYPLDPERPDTPDGVSPGRKRSKALMQWLYGRDKESVSRGLGSVKFRGQAVRLHGEPLRAFKKAAPELERLAERNPKLKAYLVPGGGFNWRRIAGENRLSPHSYGAALDLGVNVSPYWRWSKQNPHPLQKSYPPDIVAVMEDNGFIWGGKWHEYDMMHFEYRPELICKARIKALLREKPAK